MTVPDIVLVDTRQVQRDDIRLAMHEVRRRRVAFAPMVRQLRYASDEPILDKRGRESFCHEWTDRRGMLTWTRMNHDDPNDPKLVLGQQGDSENGDLGMFHIEFPGARQDMEPTLGDLSDPRATRTIMMGAEAILARAMRRCSIDAPDRIQAAMRALAAEEHERRGSGDAIVTRIHAPMPWSDACSSIDGIEDTRETIAASALPTVCRAFIAHNAWRKVTNLVFCAHSIAWTPTGSNPIDRMRDAAVLESLRSEHRP